MRTRDIFCVLSFVASVYSCSDDRGLRTGSWRATLTLQGKQLPFNFTVKKDSTGGYDVWIRNGREELLLDEVNFDGDSINIVLHVFDAELRAAARGDSLHGFFVLNYRNDYRLPFKARHGQDFRFRPSPGAGGRGKQESESPPAAAFSGSYQVLFVNESDTTPAVGMIRQEGSYAEGSFLTPTGDYRFLEGGVFNDSLFLSTFDGNHAYLFEAALENDSTISGGYWSGKSFHQTWTGIRTENPVLPDAERLTYMKAGHERLDFSFPDLNGKKISPADERFRNKVLVLQIFGTWCPNCMDETKFLNDWYKQNRSRGVEILGLAYERKDDFAYASERVIKMTQKWDVEYDFVIAGVNDKAKASETLPSLNQVTAFPTTIFIGKDGKVKHIHTGFEGPGTGVYHERFKDRFNEIINELLADHED